MSLILDALRKAEAERQRGAVPGLHDVPLAPSPPPQRPAGPRAGGLWLGAGALLLAGIVAWAWWAGRSGPAAGAHPPPLAAAPAGPAAPSALPTPSAAALPVAPTLPLVVSAPPPAPAAPTAEPRPDPVAAPVVAAVPAPAVALQPAASPAPILTQVRRLAELPPEQRRELPPLVVSGSVWSEQSAARFVVLDGQVLREGDAAAPGLVLVKLAPRAATLRWRDSLIEVPF